jgi:hypothetical protein
MKLFFILVLSAMSFTAFSQDKNIRYEYKKFKNKLPERKNFNKEMRKAVQGIR